MSTLHHDQQYILDSQILTSGFNCILQMPTGSGKTWLAEHAIEDTLNNSFRAIYLTPLRALASELYPKWLKRFSENSVGIFTGDYGKPGNPYPIPFRDSNLMIMTPEKLDACTRNWKSHWGWIPQVDLIVVDEFHLLGDRHRGSRLEGTLSRFRRLNPFSRILALSATLGNRQELSDWLQGVEFYSTWRPIPLKWTIKHFRKAEEKPQILLQVVSHNLLQGGKSLVFVQSRRRAESLEHYLQEKGIKAGHHHAGLDKKHRQETEKQFRSGQIDVLISTATLEMGLNLPVRQVVLYDLQYFDGNDFKPISTNSVWQRVGRAGRPGLDKEGEAILIAPSWDKNTKSYELGNFEDIRSGLSDTHNLAEQIITEVSAGYCWTAEQLRQTFNTSLASHQKRLPSVLDTISTMCTSGMLVIKENKLKATRIGHIAVKHMLSPETLLLFQKALDENLELTFFDLLLIATSCIDCQPAIPADFEELECLTKKLSQEPSFLLQRTVQDLSKLLQINGKRLLASMKMSLIIKGWTQNNNFEEIAKEYSCYPFEISRLKESLDRILMAMDAIKEKKDKNTESMAAEYVPLHEKINTLRNMIHGGLNETAVTLTLVDGIGYTWAKKLQNNGFDDLEELALAEPEDFSSLQGLSSKRATKWINLAQESVKSFSADRYVEDKIYTRIKDPNWPKDIDPYRLKRALELRVEQIQENSFIVSGGLEPHTLLISNDEINCDCADFDKGNLCKHILAIKIHLGDKKIKGLIRRLKEINTTEVLDLFELWFDNKAQNNRLQRRKLR